MQPLVEELGNDDPVAFLLDRAAQRLTEAAADDRAVGGALLSIQAARWSGICEHAPCRTFDRTDGFSAAGRWHPDLAAPVALWKVIALKEALDRLEVARETPLFHRSLVDLCDALLGNGAGPLDTNVVQRAQAGPPTWLALGRAVGTETTEWEEARAALGRLLAAQVDAALAFPWDAETRTLLDRVGRRAAPE
jgi:hypothetical protein